MKRQAKRKTATPASGPTWGKRWEGWELYLRPEDAAKDWLSWKDAIRITGASEGTIRRALTEGTFPPQFSRRPSRSVAWRPWDIALWLKTQQLERAVA